MISIFVDGIEYRLFDHLFAVSKCGKALRKFAPYSPKDRGDGYTMLGRRRLMHRIVAICWIDNPNNVKHVHHINGNKSDNRADNLEWVSPKEHFGDRHYGQFKPYIRTEETKSKCRVYRTGKKDSEATRLLKAEGLAINCPKTTCTFHGVSYPSISAAARVAGIPPSSFRLRCLSKNFPEYAIVKTFY